MLANTVGNVISTSCNYLVCADSCVCVQKRAATVRAAHAPGTWCWSKQCNQGAPNFTSSRNACCVLGKGHVSQSGQLLSHVLLNQLQSLCSSAVPVLPPCVSVGRVPNMCILLHAAACGWPLLPVHLDGLGCVHTYTLIFQSYVCCQNISQVHCTTCACL
jgi:hypothetical protein